MTMSLVRAPGRATTWLLAAALALTGVAVSAGTAQAADGDRVAGDDRFETAQLIAEATFDATVTDVIIATGRNYPDALAAAGLAGEVNAPVLLTEVDDLTEETRAALQALQPTTVHIAGGTSAVSAEVEAELDADYDVIRYPGDDRYDTARLIAAQVTAAGDTAIVATGEDFPDAVAGGPLAFAGPHPVLLVRENSVPPETEAALEAQNISNVVILGGTSAVSADVEAELETIVGNPAARLGGDTRNETAVEIADFGVENFGFDLSTVLIANGRQNMGVDALAGGPHGGVIGAPILLVEQDDVPSATAAFLEANAAFTDTVRALGGPAVIDQATLDEAAALATAGFEDVTLSWENEYREATGTFRNGEPGATGTANVELDAVNDTVDFKVDYGDVTGPFSGAPGFHIHVGGIADEGDVVIPLTDGATLDADADKVVTGTLTTAEIADLGSRIDAVLANPEGHYLNLHSDAYPAGAIRGQLPDGGQDEIPAADTGVITAIDAAANTYSFQVDGAAEAQVVTYADDDTFSVDGADVLVADFEAAANAGDTIAFTAAVTGDQVHALTDNPGPTVTSSSDVLVGDATWVITFSEALDPDSVACEDVSVSAGQLEVCQTVALSEGDTVLTVTFSDPFGGDETLTLAANSVTDVDGSPGPPEDLTETVP